MAELVNVLVISPDTRSERRFDSHLLVEQLKAKLETVTGITASAQRIDVYSSEDEANAPSSHGICSLNDDNRPLGFYSISEGQVLKVIDTSPPGLSLTGQFTDVSQVEKFELSEQEYAKRQDTVLAYKQRNKLGRFAQDSSTSGHEDTLQLPDIHVGQRCEVDSGEDGGLQKRGIVQFVGATEFGNKVGVWIGIQYDEPVGKNDGSVSGKRYFTCPAGYGGFVRPNRVRVGDFPPLDLDEEMEEM